MKFLNNAIFNGTITANSVADAGTNTDKFLVLNSSGVVTYRTAAELYGDLNIANLPAGSTSTVKHLVKAGVAVTKGQAVYVTSADGTNMIVGKASNASEATSSKTMGLIESTLAINGQGNVITEGLLAGLDTTGATNPGDPVWLGVDGNLIYGLANKPYAPAHLVFIGIVTRINANNGEIFVKVQNGFELKEIHDVDLITTTPVNGHILGYNGTLWVNKTIAGWLGYTPADAANIPSRTETVFTATANQTTFTVNYTVGSVEVFYNGSKMAPSEFTATNGTSIVLGTGIPEGTILTVVANSIGGGINRASLSATAPMAYDSNTGVFSMPAATSSQNGYLTSANWTTFNNKQNALTLTVTGSSGAATLVGATLNIPTYTLAGLGGQPALNGTGFVKISGTTISYDNSSYYLASNPNGYITSSGSITGDAGSLSGRTVGTSTNNIPFLSATRNLVINNPESYSGEVRLGAAWDRGGVYASGVLTMGTSASEIHFVFSNNLKAYFNSSGNLYVGQGTGASSIYMGDSDEGQRELHCNSNRIGFLTQGGAWGAYCDDSGNWTAVGDVTAYSDARVKKNVTTIENALDKVMNLRGVRYQRIDMENEKFHIGVIAQETQVVIPEVIEENKEGHLSVAYGNMGGLFIEAIKELKKENDELRDILKRNNLI